MASRSATPGPSHHEFRCHGCPACAHQIAAPLYDGGQEPLTTVALPKTEAEARALARLPLNFVRCVDCGHVFNAAFDYRQVPYSDRPYFMFNQGQTWRTHLAGIRDMILARVPRRPTVVEIGCGDAHLLAALSERRPEGRYVGFEPNSVLVSWGGAVETRPTLFDPPVHLAELLPDMLVTRHVLEHLPAPLAFLQSIAFAANSMGLAPRCLLEVPCIDAALATGRTTDLFYEHYSHFTSTSFERMLDRAGAEIELIEKGYGDEVIYAVAKLVVKPAQQRTAREARRFHTRSIQHHASLRADLDRLAASGQRVAIWGGSGKAAAFINRNGLDAQRFPLVVDSDPNKLGAFVPGAGQPILDPACLAERPVDVILIATQWRAADIVLEIRQRKIAYGQILLDHAGRLVDYFDDAHPYRGAATSPSPILRCDVHPAIPTPSFQTSLDARVS